MDDNMDFNAIMARVVECHRRADGTIDGAAVKQEIDAIRQMLEAQVAAAREAQDKFNRLGTVLTAWTEARRKKGRNPKELVWRNCVAELDLARQVDREVRLAEQKTRRLDVEIAERLARYSQMH